MLPNVNNIQTSFLLFFAYRFHSFFLNLALSLTVVRRFKFDLSNVVSPDHVIFDGFYFDPVFYFVVAFGTFTNLVSCTKSGFKFQSTLLGYHSLLEVVVAQNQLLFVINLNLVLETSGKFDILIIYLIFEISFGQLLHFFHFLEFFAFLSFEVFYTIMHLQNLLIGLPFSLFYICMVQGRISRLFASLRVPVIHGSCQPMCLHT